MLTGISLILLGVYVVMPQAISITLIVFGAINCLFGLIRILLQGPRKP